MSSTLGKWRLRASVLGAAMIACGLAAAATSGSSASAASAAGIAAEEASNIRGVYIVGLRDAPLATYDGSRPGLASAPRLANGRLDVRSSQALAYVRSLEQAQDGFMQSLSVQFGRQVAPVRPDFRFQHAFNGVVLELSADEAAELAKDPRVSLVEPYREDPLLTDAGPILIGAPTLWDGTNAPPGRRSRGEGVVIGIIDSGANIGSPSFAATATDDLVGGVPYVHANPLGAGNFLGWCNPTNPNHSPTRDICNDKMIGGWDFVDDVLTSGSPIFVAGAFEGRGFEDENSHGTHTAATAAGNRRVVTFNNVGNVEMSGVAPRANLVIYDACYTTPTGQGLCPNVSTLASINQVVADGVVDVINYSIGGGLSPWGESGAQAFLNATAAGVFVSASAGNSGPGASTLGHLSPWVMTVGASTHNRRFGFSASLTAPGTPPPNTQNIFMRPGASPLPPASLSAPLILSPGYSNGANDGCTAFPPNTFVRGGAGGTPGIAVLRFGSTTSTCGTVARRNNAVAAGAAGVLFVADTPLNAGANNATYVTTVAEYQPIADYLAANDPTYAEATISFTAARDLNGQADVMAGFSSRGPSAFNALKPDITAPGVDILAGYARWNGFGSGVAAPGALNPTLDGNVGLLSGTSMASPHNAGAAALVKALNRSWTPAQIKSALVTTSASGVLKENGTTASDAFDRGSGRTNLNNAARAGLLLDETPANFLAANPATGGLPQNLNLPSFQNGACVGTCTFPRRARGTRATPVTWTTTVTGLPAGAGSVTPSSFSTTSAAETAFTVNIDATLLPQAQWVFGEVVFTPSDASIPVARMPIAVRASAPALRVAPSNGITTSVVAGQSTTATLAVTNAGNPTLNWSYDGASRAPVSLLSQVSDPVWGNSVNFYNGLAGGVFAAEDITPSTPSAPRLTSISGEGFMVGPGSGSLAATAVNITFKLYSDNAGVPAGSPLAGSAGEVYSCVRTPTGATSAGLTIVGTTYRLDALAAAAAATSPCAAPPTLALGTRYWVSAYPTVAGTTTSRRMALSRATAVNDLPAVWISGPTSISTIPTTWTTVDPINLPPNPVGVQAFAYSVGGDVQCGAPWMSAAQTSGALGANGSTPMTLTLDASTLAAGTYRATACVSSNGTDPAAPVVGVPVTLTVTPAPTSPVASNAAASPSSVDLTGTTTLSIDVAPGANPASSGLSVTADLSSIGGSATQAMALASGSTHSFTAAIPANVTPGVKTIPVTVTDAQARTASGTIALTVNTPTSITATAVAAPANVAVTQDLTVTVDVTPGTFPASTGIAVRGDFTAIGGGASVAFTNDSGNTWTATVPVASNTVPGAKVIPVTVTEAGVLARTASASATLTVVTPNAPTATGAASPATLAPGGVTLLTVQVAQGSNPASPITAVTINTSALGGSANAPMVDDGTNGDAVAGDGIYSLSITLPGPTSAGTYALLATATDALGRTAPTAIALTVNSAPAVLFGNSFEPQAPARGP